MGAPCSTERCGAIGSPHPSAWSARGSIAFLNVPARGTSRAWRSSGGGFSTQQRDGCSKPSGRFLDRRKRRRRRRDDQRAPWLSSILISAPQPRWPRDRADDGAPAITPAQRAPGARIASEPRWRRSWLLRTNQDHPVRTTRSTSRGNPSPEQRPISRARADDRPPSPKIAQSNSPIQQQAMVPARPEPTCQGARPLDPAGRRHCVPAAQRQKAP